MMADRASSARHLDRRVAPVDRSSMDRAVVLAPMVTRCLGARRASEALQQEASFMPRAPGD